MKRQLWMFIALTVPAVWLGLAAEAAAPPLPVRVQAVGTFQAGQPSAKIVLSAAADEYEPASFILQSPKAMSGVTLKLAGDLVFGKNKIAAGAVALSAMDGNNLTPPGAFSLQPNVGKRFWMTINIPVRTVPGKYTGAVFAVAGGKAVGKLPVELNVLPLRLLKPAKQYGVLFRQCAAVDEPYKSLMARLRANSIFMVSSAAPACETAEELNAIRSAGFNACVPYLGSLDGESDAAMIAACARAAGIQRVFFSSAYEPTTEEEVEAAKTQIEALEQARLLSFATINCPAAFDQIAPSLNGVVFHVNTPYAQGLLAGQSRNSKRYEWWYWDVAGPLKETRLNAGWLLWKAKIDGAVAILPSTADGQSFLTSVQWEAFREGMDDARYATTLMAASREVKDALKVGATKNAARASKISGDTDAFLAAAFAKPLNSLSNADYQAMRLKMANFAIELRKLLK